MLDIIELFILKNAVLSAEVGEALGKLNVSPGKSEVERATDRLVEEYIQQIDYQIRTNAERMAEFYRFFTC